MNQDLSLGESTIHYEHMDILGGTSVVMYRMGDLGVFRGRYLLVGCAGMATPPKFDPPFLSLALCTRLLGTCM